MLQMHGSITDEPLIFSSKGRKALCASSASEHKVLIQQAT